MQEQITRCDICREIIDRPGGNRMFFGIGDDNSQVWSTPDGDRDICEYCLATLRIAASLGMIEIDMAQFYERAGYSIDEDDNWLRPNGEIVHNLDALPEQFLERIENLSRNLDALAEQFLERIER